MTGFNIFSIVSLKHDFQSIDDNCFVNGTAMSWKALGEGL